jgi:uncharacterized membrane protein YeaQ/YmgE (transglycosylase-associated protein family)
MNVISWILFGLIAGALAKFIMPGKDPGGCLVTAALGLLGAMLGGFISTEVFGSGTVTGFNMRSFAIAILGTILLLGVYRLILARPPKK